MRVLVVGDTILDEYFFGNVERISPEAPIPVFDFERKQEVLGGAANVAANIRTLSQDKNLNIDYFGFGSSRIISLLELFFVNFLGVSCNQNDILIKKRFVSQNHQLLRVDINKFYSQELCLVSEKNFKEVNLNQYDLIVISDYDKKTFSDKIFSYLVSSKKHIIIDLKKYRSWLMDYDLKNCIFKCNQKEFENNKIDTLLYSNMNSLIVTLGKNGYMIKTPYEPSGKQNTKEYTGIKLNGNVVDTVGAGDSFLAGMCVSFLESKEFVPEKLCEFANKVAAVSVQTFGTKVINREEVE